jgi:hypothetical protein
MKNQKGLSADKLRELSNTTNRLLAAAQAQLDEHRTWLTAEIVNLAATHATVVSQLERLTMVELVDQVHLATVKLEGQPDVHGNALVSVVYEYPDELYAFLQRPELPESLRKTLIGGTLVPDKPLVERVQL